MKSLKITLIATLITSGLFFIGCSKDDDDSDKANVATCSDGIQNQNETGVDCGGVCTPCASASPISFTKDGKVEIVNQFDAHRTTSTDPTSITLIAVTKEGNKLTIHLEKPYIVGWSDGTSLFSLTAPDMISYETIIKGTTVIYSSTNGDNSEALSFLRLEFKKGGRLDGNFSGVLDDGNGNTISIDDGDFDSTFED